MNSPASDVRPPADPALRRRAITVFAACFVLDIILALAFWGDRIGVPASVTPYLVAVAIVGGVATFTIGLKPFRKMELRDTLGREPTLIPWRQGLGLGGALLLTVPVLHYLQDEPWRVSFARIVAIAGYFAVFIPLGRLQRHGIKPYWRPTWYGFLLAGVTGGLAWAAVAGANYVNGIIPGIVYCSMHYAIARFFMRGSAIRAAQAAP